MQAPVSDDHRAAALIQAALLPVPRQGEAQPIAGVLKAVPEDFVVQEQPAYTPSGQGDHLFLWIEKRDVPAFALVDRLAHALDVGRDDIGVAGMKDARAVTRQFVSVPAAAETALVGGGKDALARDGIYVLSHTRHGNKLKTGHLQGNHFTVRVTRAAVAPDCTMSLADACAALAADTARFGLVNAFGQQRFGRGGETVRLGLGVLGVPGVPRAPRLGKSKLRLTLSAVQSALFNVYVRQRLQAGTLYRPAVGDVAIVCASGGPFVVDDAAEVAERVARHEVVLGGPLYGSKMRQATGAAAEEESDLLTRFGLDLTLMAPFAKLLRGARRPTVVWPGAIEAQCEADDVVRLSFSLPSGSYATELLSSWLHP